MVKFGFKIVTSLALLLILLVPMTSPAIAADGDETTVEELELIPTFECISVYSNFSGDNNGDNQATLYYREVGGSWKQGMALTVDRRAQIISDENYVDNPFCDQWRGSILGLTPNTEYEVRVTYNDPDGESGTDTVEASIITRNDNFTLGSGNTYYIATNGNDLNPGTQALPWRTIQHAADNVNAGDTVLIKAGTYYGAFRLTVSGAPDNYITFQNYGDGEVVIDGENVSIGQESIGTGVIIFGSSDYVGVSYNRIRGLTIRNSASNGVLINGDAYYNVIEDCTIEDFGYKIPDAGISIRRGAAYNLIQNNTITTARTAYSDPLHRASGVSVVREPGEGNVIRSNYIYGVDDGMSDGIGGWQNERWTDGPYKDCDIYGNVIGPTRDDGIESEGGDINVRIWGNTVLCGGASHFANAPVIIGPLFVFRNVFYCTSNSGKLNKVGNGVEDTGVAYVYHNTCYLPVSYSYGLTSAGGSYFSNHHWLNNIILVTTKHLDMPTASSDAEHNNTFDYDDFWIYSGGFRLQWGSTVYTSLPDFRAATNQELNGISADPKFIDPDNGDFLLQSGSPCIDAGVLLPGFNDANSPWPYQGSAPDIGAYEFNSGPIVDNTPPYTTGHSPSKGASGIARTTNITVHVRDSGVGVDQSSIVMTVEGGAVTPTITGTPADYTLTYNPPSDFDYEQVVNVTINAQDLDSPPNVMTQDVYSFSIAAVDNTPPYTTGHNPAKGASGIARTTDITVHVRDSGDGVDQSSIVMTVEGGAVTPTITGTPADYTLTYNPPSDFDYEQVVDVTVDAQDLAPSPNTMTQDTYSFTIAVDGSQWLYLPVRVNCAGVDYTDGSSNVWKADQAYVSGSWGFYGADNTVDRGTGLAISGTADDRIYQTERYGLDGYIFDLGDGIYDVSLHFAETYDSITGTGQRVFDVSIEGQLVLDNLDIYDEVGGNAALIKTINNISVTDGQLTITFTQITENPLINGIMIADAAGNQPPVALNDSYSVAVDGTLNVPSPGVLSNDSDGDSDQLTAILVSDVSHGSLTLNSNGSFTYTPDPGYTGTDSFTYRANDGQDNSNTATVTITVSSVNQPPVLMVSRGPTPTFTSKYPTAS